MLSRQTTDVVLHALHLAVWRRKPEQRVLIHSDHADDIAVADHDVVKRRGGERMRPIVGVLEPADAGALSLPDADLVERDHQRLGARREAVPLREVLDLARRERIDLCTHLVDLVLAGVSLRDQGQRIVVLGRDVEVRGDIIDDRVKALEDGAVPVCLRTRGDEADGWALQLHQLGVKPGFLHVGFGILEPPCVLSGVFLVAHP